MNEHRRMPTFTREIVNSLADSATLIAIVVATLYFAGWTYRQAYYLRFGVDPSSLDGSNVAVAVEGLGAILTTTAAWLVAVLPLPLMAILSMAIVRWLERNRQSTSSGPFFDRIAVIMIRIGTGCLAVLLVMAAGQIAAVKQARDRIANVRDGNVWTYHLAGEVIYGVMVAQSKDLTWVLTKQGIRILKTKDIILINGPLLARL